MEIFIGGAREIKTLPTQVTLKLKSICNKNYSVVVGDANGIDKAVQQFFYLNNYRNVKVYASNGVIRNNIGNWEVENIKVPKNLKGFDFYKQKDINMAKIADYGFMIWNGRSKGTLNNMVNLIKYNKKVVLYFKPKDRIEHIKNFKDIEKLFDFCPKDTINNFYEFTNNLNEQLALI